MTASLHRPASPAGPRIPDRTTLDATDRLATAEELAAALDEAQRRGARRICIGSGRSPIAGATAHAVTALWEARGGTVADVIDWSETAASWLRPAQRLAGSPADAWITVGTGRGWMQMTSRLLWSTDWDLGGLSGTTRGGGLWTIERRGRQRTR